MPPSVRPTIQETTALDTVHAAGLAVRLYKNLDDLRANWSADYTWQPNLEAQKREEMYRLWKQAVTRSFDWAS